jgi:surface antigen
MRHYDDETLGAYIDGELDRETTKALEADLKNDRCLQRQVAQLRAITAALREWCVEQARPQEHSQEHSLSLAMMMDHLNEPRPRAIRGFVPLWSHALAASLALVLGISIGQFVNLSAQQHGTDADEAARQLLQSALEHTLSGQTIAGTDDTTQHKVTVEPIHTYRASGTFCREYRQTAVTATQPDERTMYGLACRSPEGKWSVEYTVAPGARSLLANP